MVQSKSPEATAPAERPSHGPFQPGQKIADRYRIVSLLGRGGMGEVYRADDLHLAQSVALKFLPPRVSADPLALDRFKSEVRTARGISHPNVCRIHDFGEADGQAFLSMEYVDGEDLSGVLKRLGRPSKEKAVEIARQICLGLAAVHEAGVIHRDLKPANIMIDGRGNVRLMDFGIAGTQMDRPAGEAPAGTPNYMAPELFRGGTASVPSDLYALGLVLYELFTGKRALTGDMLQRIREPSSTTSLTTPSSIVTDMDPLVERAIMRCLESDPERRPGSVYALLAMLPGGDPLAAAMAAGQTPSPEMVAAAGETGLLSQRAARTTIGAIFVGLALVCWLAQSAYLVNRIDHWKHPEVLANDARQMFQDWDYDKAPWDEAFGFYRTEDEGLGFWYRRTPEPVSLVPFEFWSDWGDLSMSRPNYVAPTWRWPGESGANLTLDGKLIRFRAQPELDPDKPPASGPSPWSEWFSLDRTGYDLASLDPVDDLELPPPDAYDQVRVWKGSKAGDTNAVYLEAAAYRNRPVYFEVFEPAQFEKAWSPTDLLPKDLKLGRKTILYLYLAALIGGAAVAWRNVRTGRSDRKGAFRIAFFLFGCGMLAWLLLANHRPYIEDEAPAFVLGVAQALLQSAIFWVFYMALEPFVRRLWPQTLISWARLVEGQWRDPLVGRDILAGILLGTLFTLLLQLHILAPSWLGLSPQPPLSSHVLTLESPAALIGYFLNVMLSSLQRSIFSLLLLMSLRSVLKKPLLGWLVFLAIMTPTLQLLFQFHPVLGWFLVLLSNSAYIWVICRFGFLTAATWSITRILLESPITADLSAWYAKNGLIAVSLVALLSLAAFRTCQRRTVTA